MRHSKMLILLLALLGAASCERVERAGGCLRIEFETGAPLTKAAGPDGNVADGGGIFLTNAGTPEAPVYRPDLVILVANASSGTIEGCFDGLAESNTGCALEGTPSTTRMAVSFSNLTGGERYTVYAFANTQGLWTLKNGEIPVGSLTDLTSASQVEALQFRPEGGDLDASGCLVVKNGRLPLSAKGSVQLTALGNGEISLPLPRCVAKVTAVFENQYGSDLTLTDFSNAFAHMNPSTGFVVPHDGDFAVAHGDAGDLVADSPSLTIVDDDRLALSWYVFPSVGPYACDVSFSLLDVHHSYSNLPVHDDHARDIPQLARNQHLTITTRISAGKKVSFNFEVADWDTKEESVMFN